MDEVTAGDDILDTGSYSGGDYSSGDYSGVDIGGGSGDTGTISSDTTDTGSGDNTDNVDNSSSILDDLLGNAGGLLKGITNVINATQPKNTTNGNGQIKKNTPTTVKPNTPPTTTQGVTVSGVSLSWVQLALIGGVALLLVIVVVKKF